MTRPIKRINAPSRRLLGAPQERDLYSQPDVLQNSSHQSTPKESPRLAILSKHTSYEIDRLQQLNIRLFDALERIDGPPPPSSVTTTAENMPARIGLLGQIEDQLDVIDRQLA